MQTFSIVVDDEVTRVDHQTLQDKRLMQFAKTARAKAKSNVVAFKLRERARKKAS